MARVDIFDQWDTPSVSVNNYIIGTNFSIYEQYINTNHHPIFWFDIAVQPNKFITGKSFSENFKACFPGITDASMTSGSASLIKSGNKIQISVKTAGTLQLKSEIAFNQLKFKYGSSSTIESTWTRGSDGVATATVNLSVGTWQMREISMQINPFWVWRYQQNNGGPHKYGGNRAWLGLASVRFTSYTTSGSDTAYIPEFCIGGKSGHIRVTNNTQNKYDNPYRKNTGYASYYNWNSEFIKYRLIRNDLTKLTAVSEPTVSWNSPTSVTIDGSIYYCSPGSQVLVFRRNGGTPEVIKDWKGKLDSWTHWALYQIGIKCDFTDELEIAFKDCSWQYKPYAYDDINPSWKSITPYSTLFDGICYNIEDSVVTQTTSNNYSESKNYDDSYFGAMWIGWYDVWINYTPSMSIKYRYKGPHLHGIGRPLGVSSTWTSNFWGYAHGDIGIYSRAALRVESTTTLSGGLVQDSFCTTESGTKYLIWNVLNSSFGYGTYLVDDTRDGQKWSVNKLQIKKRQDSTGTEGGIGVYFKHKQANTYPYVVYIYNPYGFFPSDRSTGLPSSLGGEAEKWFVHGVKWYAYNTNEQITELGSWTTPFHICNNHTNAPYFYASKTQAFADFDLNIPYGDNTTTTSTVKMDFRGNHGPGNQAMDYIMKGLYAYKYHYTSFFLVDRG